MVMFHSDQLISLCVPLLLMTPVIYGRAPCWRCSEVLWPPGSRLMQGEVWRMAPETLRIRGFLSGELPRCHTKGSLGDIHVTVPMALCRSGWKNLLWHSWHLFHVIMYPWDVSPISSLKHHLLKRSFLFVSKLDKEENDVWVDASRPRPVISHHGVFNRPQTIKMHIY